MAEIFRAGVTLYLVDRLTRQLSGVSRSFRQGGKSAEDYANRVALAERKLDLLARRGSLLSEQRQIRGRMRGLPREASLARIEAQDQLKANQVRMSMLANEMQILAVQEKRLRLVKKEAEVQAKTGLGMKAIWLGAAGATALGITSKLAKNAEQLSRSFMELHAVAPSLNQKLFGPIALAASQASKVLPERTIVDLSTEMARAGLTPEQIQRIAPAFGIAAGAVTEARGGGKKTADPKAMAKALGRLSTIFHADPSGLIAPLFAAAMLSPDGVTAAANLAQRLGPSLLGRTTPTDLLELATFGERVTGEGGPFSSLRLISLVSRLRAPGASAPSMIKLGLGGMIAGKEAFSVGNFVRDLTRASKGMSSLMFDTLWREAFGQSGGISGGAGIQELLKHPEMWKSFKETFDKARDATRTLNEEMSFLPTQMDRSAASVRNLSQNLGTPLLVPLLKFEGKLNDFLDIINKWVLQHPEIVSPVGKAIGAGGVAAVGAATIMGSAWLLRALKILGPVGLTLGPVGEVAAIAAAAVAIIEGSEYIEKKFPSSFRKKLGDSYDAWARAAGAMGPLPSPSTGAPLIPTLLKKLSDALDFWTRATGRGAMGPFPPPSKGVSPLPPTHVEPYARASGAFGTHFELHPGAITVSLGDHGDMGLEDRIKAGIVEGLRQALLGFGGALGSFEAPSLHTAGTETL